MANITAKQLAALVGIPVTHLFDQFKQAGVTVSDPEQTITDQEKQTLLMHLQKGRKSAQTDELKTISLVRRSVTKVRSGGTGAAQSKMVNIEVRKKRTYVQQPSLVSAKAKIVEETISPIIETVPPTADTLNTTLTPELIINPPLTKAAADTADKRKLPTPADKKTTLKKKDKRGKRHGNHYDEDGTEPLFFKTRNYATSTVVSHGFTAPTAPIIHEVTIPETYVVDRLAALTGKWQPYTRQRQAREHRREQLRQKHQRQQGN